MLIMNIYLCQKEITYMIKRTNKIRIGYRTKVRIL